MALPEVSTGPGAAVRAFADRHLAALERDEARHSLMLGLIEQAVAAAPEGLFLWSAGEPGACAMQWPERPLALADLDEGMCRDLADAVAAHAYPAVSGGDRSAPWFVERAQANGHRFDEPMPLAIHALRERPAYPGSPGAARLATPDDIDLVFEWSMAFWREAVPHDRPPERDGVKARLGMGRMSLWETEGEPVSVASFTRQTRSTGSISFVFTPPHRRGRGFGGAVVSAVADRIFAAGKTSVCLYTDLRNPFSNRCYAKIGFKRIADAYHFQRRF